MKTYARPPKAGIYAEYITGEGFVRYYPVTEEQVALRHALATALGYTIRQPCSFCTASYPAPCDGTHKHGPCYESVELHDKGYALTHQHHDHTDMPYTGKLPEGTKILSWPEEVSAAALAAELVQRGQSLDDVVGHARNGEDDNGEDYDGPSLAALQALDADDT